MKRVFIVHGWAGFPEEGFFPWLKSELIKRGFSVFVPVMPNALAPKIEEWIPFLSEQVGKPDSETYFVGHRIVNAEFEIIGRSGSRTKQRAGRVREPTLI